MKTHVADTVELFDAVVEFVKLPQPRNSVQQVMHTPLHEVFQNQEGNKLDPKWRIGQELYLLRDRKAPAFERTPQRLQSPIGKIGK